jgi:hypothetical protein
MPLQLFTNNTKTTVSAAFDSSATSLSVADGSGMPSLSGGDWFLLTLTQPALETSWEIVKVTARSGNVLTVVRGQENTANAVWALGSAVQLRITASTMDSAVTGTTGPAGAAGASAYQVAVLAGYVGTEAQWLVSLQMGTVGLSLDTEILADAPHNYWKLNETSGATAIDYGSSNTPMTYTGTTLAYAAIVPSSSEKFPLFFGTTAKAVTANQLGFTVPVIGSMTIEGIVVPYLDNVNPMHLISLSLTGETLATNFQFSLYAVTSGDVTTFWEQGLGVNVSPNVTSGIKLLSGKPHHLVLTKNSVTKQINWWVNGIRGQPASYTLEPSGGTTAVGAIGYNGNDLQSSAVRAHIALYDKVLTEERIVAHAKAAGLYTSATLRGTDGAPGVAGATGAAGATVLGVNTFGFKNRCINGDIRFDQPNNGALVSIPNSALVNVMDMFTASGAGSAGVFSVQQLNPTTGYTAPTGFYTFLRAKVSTLDLSPISTSSYIITTRIEGYNVMDFLLGGATAIQFTCSFWVRSSLTGVFSGAFNNFVFNRSYPFNFTIVSANTWEKKTVTLTGDNSGAWPVDINIGLALTFELGGGSLKRSVAPSTWQTGPMYGCSGAVNLISTLNATFDVTGIQIEAGAAATSWDYRSYQTELAQCQRYYYKLMAGAGAPLAFGGMALSTQVQAFTPFPVTMRTVPSSLSYSGTWTDYGASQNLVPGVICSGVPMYLSASVAMAKTRFDVPSGSFSSGSSCHIYAVVSGASLAWSARL